MVWMACCPEQQALLPTSLPLYAVKLLFSLLPEQQAELQHLLGWLRHLWSLVRRAIVVKASLGAGRSDAAQPGKCCSPASRPILIPALWSVVLLLTGLGSAAPADWGEEHGGAGHAAPHAGPAAERPAGGGGGALVLHGAPR